MQLKGMITRRTFLLDKMFILVLTILIFGTLSNSVNSSAPDKGIISPLAVPVGADDNYETLVDTLNWIKVNNIS